VIRAFGAAAALADKRPPGSVLYVEPHFSLCERFSGNSKASRRNSSPASVVVPVLKSVNAAFGKLLADSQIFSHNREPAKFEHVSARFGHSAHLLPSDFSEAQSFPLRL
jgi:hypothetical protein